MNTRLTLCDAEREYINMRISITANKIFFYGIFWFIFYRVMAMILLLSNASQLSFLHYRSSRTFGIYSSYTSHICINSMKARRQQQQKEKNTHFPIWFDKLFRNFSPFHTLGFTCYNTKCVYSSFFFFFATRDKGIPTLPMWSKVFLFSTLS